MQRQSHNLSYRGLVRTDNTPFESPRGRARNNPGWGRVDGIPFESPRGRGRNNPGWGRVDGIPFESPRGRGRNNPGWGRVDGIPYESPRGRGGTSCLREQSTGHSKEGDASNVFHTEDTSSDEDEQTDNLMSSDVIVGYRELPRGRGRGNPGSGRVDNYHSRIAKGIVQPHRSQNVASAPSYEDIMDVE